MQGRWRKFDTKLTLHERFRDAQVQGKRFDAIFIPTRGKPINVSELIHEISQLEIANTIYLLPTTDNDIPQSNKKTHNLHKLYLKFLKNHHPQLSTKKWDLPHKRNFAVCYSKQKSYKKILLLDDDIRFHTFKDSAYKLYVALEQSWLASAYSTVQYDTSLVSEIAMKFGINRPAFLSGNCVAINLTKFTPYFPNIYNEDWLSFLPALFKHKALLVGPVVQLKRQCNNRLHIARFQEFGEVIADELYSHVLEPAVYSTCRMSQ